MKHNTILILSLCILLLSGCSQGGNIPSSEPATVTTTEPTTIPTESATKLPTEPTVIPTISREEYTVAPEPLYPFVYDYFKADMFDDAWGDYEAIEGYLYVKNMDTKEIVQISNEPVVPVFEDTLDNLFCITETNQLIQTDYTGKTWTVLYEAQHGDLLCVEYYDGSIYFIDGEHIQIYDLENAAVATLTELPGAVSVYPCNENTFLLRKDSGEYISYDRNTKEFSGPLDDSEVDALISG